MACERNWRSCDGQSMIFTAFYSQPIVLKLRSYPLSCAITRAMPALISAPASWRRRLPARSRRPASMERPWARRVPEQLAAIRHLAFGDGGDNLLGGPVAEARFLVGGQVAADENADDGNPESDLGARE